MQISDVQHLANLARLDIPQEEQEALLQDLIAMISYVDQVSAVDIQGKEQSVSEIRNVVREDVVTNTPGSNTEAILTEVPDTQDGYVKVKKILA